MILQSIQGFICKILFHSLLHSILSTMEEECQTYAVMDTNNLISKTAHWCYRLTNIIISTTIASTVFYVIGVFTSEGVNATTPRELLLKMDLPFDTSKSPTFELVVIVQYFYQASSAFIFAVFSGLLLMIVSININTFSIPFDSAYGIKYKI